MTGLDTNRHTIVEIALLITDADLNVLDDGIDLVVHATPEELACMDDFVVGMHTKSGLLPQIQAATLSLPKPASRCSRTCASGSPNTRRAVRQLHRGGSALPRPVPPDGGPVPPLPEHRRELVEGTRAALAPAVLKGQPAKQSTHRALDDIRESIEELRYYRTAFLKLPEPEAPSHA